MRIDIFGKCYQITTCSIVGRRIENQDSFGWIAFTKDGLQGTVMNPTVTEGQELLLAIVCDGMGGLRYGKEASQTVVDRTMDWILSVKRDSLDSLVEVYHNIILPQIEHDIMLKYEGSGTTLSMLIGMEGRWVSLHLGDSRLYAIDTNGSVFRTEDHAPVEAMRKAGIITENEMEDHPMKNIISFYVGGGHADKLEIHNLDQWQRLILCSDGAYGYVPCNDFLDMISNYDAPEIVNKCYNLGSTDNISVISLISFDDNVLVNNVRNHVIGHNSDSNNQYSSESLFLLDEYEKLNSFKENYDNVEGYLSNGIGERSESSVLDKEVKQLNSHIVSTTESIFNCATWRMNCMSVRYKGCVNDGFFNSYRLIQ